MASTYSFHTSLPILLLSSSSSSSSPPLSPTSLRRPLSPLSPPATPPQTPLSAGPSVSPSRLTEPLHLQPLLPRQVLSSPQVPQHRRPLPLPLSTLSHTAINALEDCQLLAELNIDFLVSASSTANSSSTLLDPQTDKLQTLLSSLLTNQQTCLDGLQAALVVERQERPLGPPL
ncbi:putative pectinesterase/pectinesterase inhibitor 41 [Iris pallida]|uniref:Pectinesterase/pectinesterase inhibitor 41 n=1 Tax=Iris pallida TaxID=29817 RepID=A0AAX6F876_IRIPA|nr:putative pectinesterase/pectinesterase inhibitor 41 [Iris pallida]